MEWRIPGGMQARRDMERYTKGYGICPKGNGDALLASEQGRVWSVLMA